MTAIFQDIKQMLKTPRQLAPIPGINYAEVLYADDTLIFWHTYPVHQQIFTGYTSGVNST